jgi:uridine phosphorylase
VATPEAPRYITPDTLLRLRFGDAPWPQWDVAVLCFRGDTGSDALVRKLNARPVGRKILYGLEESLERPFVYEARLGRSRVVIVGRCLWGAPQTAILVEELACLGVRVILGFGVAGSLVETLDKGAQLVATRGLVTDGTSRAYTSAAEVGPDPGLRSALSMTAADLGIEVTPAKIATVDALYRETPADVRRWLSLGATAINMETTPLYAAATVCGVRSLWLGHVSDTLSLATHAWDSWQRPLSMTDVTVALTVGLLERLC